MVSTVTVGTTVQRRYETDSDRVSVQGRDEKDVSLTREVENVEDAEWLLAAKDHEVVSDLWSDVKEDPDFEGFGWYGYPKGDISVNLSYKPSWVDVVESRLEGRDDADEDATPEGIYLDLVANRRAAVDDRGRVKMLCRFLADRGISTREWTHGRKPGQGTDSVF